MSDDSPVVWLASYPRSGNTLTRRMIHDATGWPTFSIYHDNRIVDSEREKLGHVELAKWDWTKPNWQPLSPPGHPMFVKTHEWPGRGDRRAAILIVRDGRDVCASYARYLVEKAGYANQATALEDVIQGRFQRGLWGEWNHRWLAYDGPLRVLKYEEILKSPDVLSRCINDICGDGVIREMSIPSLEQSRAADPGFFHRGGSWWREVFSAKQLTTFWKIHGETMRRLGYHE